ncbi:hypothetical protein IQ07DRAFT_678610 [Pyrenochaeta sp. DS3sAY3a]|nr:hypothetical protein IQ07DRAFT_678610 [Pyrenochaeta sp. DS3sAY3a]
MPSIVVAAQLVTANEEARQKIIAALSSVSQFSKKSEPGVVRYAICVPRDEEADSSSVYVFEEYLTQSALDAHMASKPVQEELIAYFGSNPTFFGGAPTIYTTTPVAAFERADILSARDPVIVFSSSLANEEAAGTVQELQRAEGVLGYGAYVDKEDGQAVKTIGVFESERAREQVAKKGEGVSLRLVGGYLGKERTAANL